MGRRGPAPQPTALKLLHGQRESRINRNEPIARDALPICPDVASDEVREIWDYTVRELAAMKVLTAADRDSLVCYCEAVTNHRKSSALLKRSDVIIKGDHGGPVRNPALAVQRDSAELIRRFAQEFGLTPSGRSRISAQDAGRAADDGDNPFAATP